MVIFENLSDNITRPYTLFQVTNEVTGGLFGNLILLAIFIVIFISLKDYRNSIAFATASFITTILAMLFRTMGIIGDMVMIVGIVATVASVAYLLFEGRWK